MHAHPVDECHGVDLDDVVPGQVKMLQALQVPEDPLRNGRQGIPRQVQLLQGQCQRAEVRPAQVTDGIVWKKKKRKKNIQRRLILLLNAIIIAYKNGYG